MARIVSSPADARPVVASLGGNPLAALNGILALCPPRQEVKIYLVVSGETAGRCGPFERALRFFGLSTEVELVVVNPDDPRVVREKLQEKLGDWSTRTVYSGGTRPMAVVLASWCRRNGGECWSTDGLVVRRDDGVEAQVPASKALDLETLATLHEAHEVSSVGRPDPPAEKDKAWWERLLTDPEFREKVRQRERSDHCFEKAVHGLVAGICAASPPAARHVLGDVTVRRKDPEHSDAPLRECQLDIVIIDRATRLTVLEVKVSENASTKARLHLEAAEVGVRAVQYGGMQARAGLVTLLESRTTKALERELRDGFPFSPNVEVFGMDELADAVHLRKESAFGRWLLGPDEPGGGLTPRAHR